MRVLARVLQGVLAGRREACIREPSVKCVEVAVRVLLRVASRSAICALQAGKLRGLGAHVQGWFGVGQRDVSAGNNLPLS